VNCFAAATISLDLAMLVTDNWRFADDSAGTQGEIEARVHRGLEDAQPWPDTAAPWPNPLTSESRPA
jgi:hypothetical protein